MLLFSTFFLYSVRVTEKVPYLEKGWEYTWDNVDVAKSTESVQWHPMEFPGQPPERNDRNELWLRVKLPDQRIIYPTAYMKFVRQSFEVYLDDVAVYQYDDPSFRDQQQFTPFYPWHLFLLPSDMAGKTLYFHIRSHNINIGIMGMVQYGSLMDILSDKILLDSFKFFTSTISFFLGACVFPLYLRNREKKIYLAFSGATIIGAILVFSTTFACMLIWNNALFWTRTIFIAGLYWPVPLIYFFSYVAEPQYCSYVKRMGFFIFVISSVGIMFFLWDPSLFQIMYIFTPVIYSVIYLAILYTFRRQLRHNLEAQIFVIGFTIWFSTLFYDLLSALHIISARTTIHSLGQFGEILALTMILIFRYLDNKKIKILQ